MTQRQAGIADIVHRAGKRGKSIAATLLCAASLIALPASAATPAPIMIAIFDFELEDFSAGASSTGESPSDAKQLTSVTSEIRSLFTQSAGATIWSMSAARTRMP